MFMNNTSVMVPRNARNKNTKIIQNCCMYVIDICRNFEILFGFVVREPLP